MCGLCGSPGRHLLMVCVSVCVDIFVREQSEEVGMTVPFRRVRKERSEHSHTHTKSHCSHTCVGTSPSHLFLI